MKCSVFAAGVLTLFVGGSRIEAASGKWSSDGHSFADEGGVQSLSVALSRPVTLYAGTHYGVWKSVDAGRSWSSAGLEGNTIFFLAVDPSDPETVYAMTGDDYSAFTYQALSKTEDGGSSWKTLVPLDRFESLAPIDVDPTDPSTVYAAHDAYFYSGRPLGIAKSTDGFASFTVVGPDLPSGSVVHAFVLDPVDPSILHLINDGGEYESDDRGETWFRIGD